MGVIIRGKATIELVHEFGPTYSDNELLRFKRSGAHTVFYRLIL